MELAGKEVAFEATAAGAVKWRVVDHAEVAQHAKGAPLWCFARAASVLWLHRVFASQTPSAGQCDACLQPSTCSATRKTLCMDALRLPPSPTFTCLQFVNSSPPLAPRCRREQLLCQAQAAARGHPALERQVDGGHGRLCQRGECSHSCVVPPLLSPACCGYLLRHGWLSSHMVRGSSRCICVIGLLPAANRRSIAACLLMWELRVSAARVGCAIQPRTMQCNASSADLACRHTPADLPAPMLSSAGGGRQEQEPGGPARQAALLDQPALLRHGEAGPNNAGYGQPAKQQGGLAASQVAAPCHWQPVLTPCGLACHQLQVPFSTFEEVLQRRENKQVREVLGGRLHCAVSPAGCHWRHGCMAVAEGLRWL